MSRIPFHALPRAAGPLLTALALSSAASTASANPLAPAVAAGDGPVVVIVRVPKPWYVPRALIASKMRDTEPQYAALPGLAHKAYSFAQRDGAFGGVYLWADGAAARAWFSPAWFERVRRERGVEGEVRVFPVSAVINGARGGPGRDDRADAVATVAPAGDGRAPETGLLRRHAVATPAGTPAWIELWRSAAAAEAAFAARGVAVAEVEWFDTPILLPGAAAARLEGLR